MYRGHKIAAVVPAFNEEQKIGTVVRRILEADVGVDWTIVVDDASTDDTANIAAKRGAHLIQMPTRGGVGKAIGTGYREGIRLGADVLVTVAGNNKDEPKEIPHLLDPICDDGCDFVMGSRYLPGGTAGGDMPGYRRWATMMHPWLLSRLVGKRLTESTNGFRAVTRHLLDDPGIKLDQPWLDNYGMEVYLLYKAIKLGFSHTEVSCTKIYPPRETGNTKMMPVIGWWNILRPIFLLGLGIRK